MRADAKKNYDHLLSVAREAIDQDGVEISMRDLARRAEVGLATLLRHFPTREALFEALLATSLDGLTKRAEELEASDASAEALVTWIREWVAFALANKGVVALMAAAHTNPASALYAACAAVHAASTRILERAQDRGRAQPDVKGEDLFGLMCGLGWLVDLPPFAPRADHLAKLLGRAVLTDMNTPTEPVLRK
jgi:AcrR family transcriptional regulator